METDRSSRTYRRETPSFFFPVLLITVGAVWLLVNNGTIPVENVYRLAPFWPVLLIIAGISLMLQRLWWPLSALLWLGTAAAVVGVLLFAPNALPQRTAGEYKHETFSEPVGTAESATVSLNLSIHSTDITALQGSNELVQAELDYLGDVQFTSTGSEQKSVRLDHNFNDPFFFFNTGLILGESKSWQIGLTPDIPLRLRVDTGTGSTRMNLAGLQLESLTVEGGTGSIQVDLPADAPRFPFSLDVGTGSVTIRVPEGTAFDLDSEGGTGSLTIDVPDGAGVQVEVKDGGVGSLNLPDGFTKVRGDSDDDEGTWENEAYATSDASIKITLDIGTGSVNIR